MNLKQLIEETGLRIITGENKLNLACKGVYVSDLLSDVMGHAKEGQIWLTIQTHTNVVAVALLLNLAAVVFTSGVKPDPATVDKAKAEGIPLLSSDLPTYELAGRIYQLLNTGVNR